MRTVNILALALVIIGGLNWGLIGLFDFNLVTALFGSMPMIEKVVYILVGLAAVYSLTLFRPLTAYNTLATTRTVDAVR